VGSSRIDIKTVYGQGDGRLWQKKNLIERSHM
jgi:hypothetical protein